MRDLALALTLAMLVPLAACGARTSVFDDPTATGFGGASSVGNGAGAGIANGSGPGSGPATGAGAGSFGGSNSVGEGTGSVGAGETSTGSGPDTSTGTGSDGTPFGEACASFLDALAHAGEDACGQCLTEAPLGPCAPQVHKTSKLNGPCAGANACAQTCSTDGFCDCLTQCLQAAPKRCKLHFANAFWCISGACGSECEGG